jgi:hypothetical protein
MSIADDYQRAGRLLLPMGEEDPRKTYTMPDPDGLCDAMVSIYDDAWHRKPQGPRVEVDLADLRRVLGLATGYLDLTTYALGQEHCVQKLRDIWRSRRAHREESGDE